MVRSDDSLLIDNRKNNTLENFLGHSMRQSKSLDIATGYFEIGALLALSDSWHHLDKIRILMGDEISRSTKEAILSAIDLNTNIEDEKRKDDTLSGLSTVQAAISFAKIEIRVYTRSKFHAKAYLLKTDADGQAESAVIGSSNFTRPGLARNLELNLVTQDPQHTAQTQAWFDELWERSELVDDDVLKVIERHLREYDPFTVYARALNSFFEGKEKSQTDWERNNSLIYPMLSQYQKDGYHQALQIADEWGGALVCDGVGLGKTYIGLMILESCLQQGRRVLMIVPKSAEKSVWRTRIDKLLAPEYHRLLWENLDIRRHTDFSREDTISAEDLEYFVKYKDVILIDEAHHFRNPNSNRGKLLMEVARDKQQFFLTATPINNRIDDLYHLINYFAQNNHDHFSHIGIQHLRRYFLELDAQIEAEYADREIMDAVGQRDLLRTDQLLHEVLIQRSRKYVKASESLEDTQNIFPERQLPRVIEYSLRNVYESLYLELKEAFSHQNPFLTLAIYNTSNYHHDPDERQQHSQRQVISLIRILLLKRLESSFKSFEASTEDLLAKMAEFMRYYGPQQFESWQSTNRRWWSIVQDHVQERLDKENEADEEDEEDNDIPERFEIEPEHHDMDRLLQDVQSDMEILTTFLSKIYRRFYLPDQEGRVVDPEKDQKIVQLKKYLAEEPLLKGRKVAIFTEFRPTARHIAQQLRQAGFQHLEQIDGGRGIDREDVIKRFSPHYNCDNQERDLLGKTELDQYLERPPIQILITTDILSEGLNLQDASLLINYDLHWNPVRLMQRIGRVDRRLDLELEAVLDRPADLDRKVFFWNFLPPQEIEDLLQLKNRLDGKILRINLTLGIEGALLTPDDPEMSLKEFNQKYEGQESVEELMNLERQRLSQQHPELWASLSKLPMRLFSGKVVADGFEPLIDREGDPIEGYLPNQTVGLFCAYRLPNLSQESEVASVGDVHWFFYDLHQQTFTDNLKDCWTAIRCVAETSRRADRSLASLSQIQKKIYRHIHNTHLRAMQAPIGTEAELLAWMELRQE